MIDDRVGFQIYSDRGRSSRTCRGPAAQTPEGQGISDLFDVEAFRRSDLGYAAAGIETHPKKRRRGDDCATVWGVEIEGKAGLIGAPRHKIAAMMI